MKRLSGLPVLLWLAGVGVCIAIIAHTRFTADLSAFLPKAPTEEQRVLVDQLRDGTLSRLVLVGIEGSDTATRARISRLLADDLRQAEEFSSIHNGDARETAHDREYFFANRYLLSPAVTPERFTAGGLHDAIAESIDLLASPVGMMLKSVLTRDPTGEIANLAGTLERSAQPQKIDGVWASKDGKRAILLAQTKASGSDIDAQERALLRVRNAFGRAVAQAGTPAGNISLLMTGPGVFAVASRATIHHEVVRLSLLSTAIIVTLLLLLYRSPTALALGLLPVASGALAAVAAVSLGFGQVHGLTLGFGTTLIGEAVDYSIYLFIQSEPRGSATAAEFAAAPNGNGDDRVAREANWILGFWPTIRLGVLTSICGFATLLLSGFPGLAQLGLYSVCGLIVAALVTRFVLPHLMPRTFRIRDLTGLGGALASLVERATNRRFVVATLALMVAVAAGAVLFVHRDALWNRELSALSPVSAADQALDQSLRNDLGAPDSRYLIVVPAADAEKALAAAERVANALQPLVDSGALAGFESPARFLPSIATQRARQAALPERTELEARLRQATAGLPLRAERLAPFVDDVEAARSRTPLQREDLDGTSIGEAFDALVAKQGERWTAAIPLRGPATATARLDPAPIRAALAAAAVPEALFVDVKAEADRLYSGYLNEAIALALAGLAAIVVLLAIALRSPARVLRVIVPLLLAVLVVAAALAIAGRQMTILHLIGMLLIVAVGSNYALFFDRAPKSDDAGRDPARLRMLASLLCANVTTVAGFGLLAFSSVPVLNAIGMTVGPGAVLALVFAAALSGRREKRIAAQARAG